MKAKSAFLSGVSIFGLLACTGPVVAAGSSGPSNYGGAGGNPASWSEIDNWNQAPTAGSIVSLISPDPQTVEFDDNSAPVLGSLIVDGLSASGGMILNTSVSFSTIGGMIVGAQGQGAFNQTGGTTSFGQLTVGSQIGSSGTVTLSGGVMNDSATIGDAGTGTFNNLGATHNVSGNLILGNQASGNGTYTISGDIARTNVTFAPGAGGIPDPSGSNGYYRDPTTGVITGTRSSSNGALIIGESGTGSFTQGSLDGLGNPLDPNNQVNVAGDVVLGHQAGSQGTYTLNTGTLTVGGKLAVGGDSTNANVFTQNGGLVNVTGSAGPNDGSSDYVGVGNSGNAAGWVIVGGGGGDTNTGVGTYNLTGGSLITTGGLAIGDAGTGTFNQTGGTLQVGSVGADPDMVVGAQAGSVGAYNLSGGGAATVNGNMIIGRDGAFGSNAAAMGSVAVGTVGAVGDTTNLTVTDTIVVASGGIGSLTQYSGTVTTVGLSIGGGGGVGAGGIYPDNGTGTYTMAGGTLNASLIEVGHSGVGVFTQTDGTVNAGFSLSLGNCGGCNAGNASGTYALSGGVLNVGSGGTQVGLFGYGQFDQSGGTHSIAGTLDIASGPFVPFDQQGIPARQGIYNMSGGILVAQNAIVGDGGQGTFNHTGGLVTIGYGYGGQVLADGSTVPGAPNGPGVVGTLVVGAQGNNTIDLGGGNIIISSSNGGYNLGVTGQTNTATWGGYASGSPGTPALAFDSSINAPYVQVFGNVVVGRDAGSVGAFTLAGDGSYLQVNNVAGTSGNGTMVIGASGTGSFTQSDNSGVYLEGGMAIGLNAGATGSYTLNSGANGGGSLFVGGDLLVGGSDDASGGPLSQAPGLGGTGTFTQNDGFVQVAGNLKLGTNAGASGVYSLNNGNLNVDNVGYLGNNGGTATVNQAGGTATFGSDSNAGGLVLGTGAGTDSAGTYNLTGIAQLTVNGNVTLGLDAGTTGSITIGNGDDSPTMNVNATSSSVFSDGNMTIGDAGAGNLTVNSGALNVAGIIAVGVNGTGIVTQNGGSVTALFLDLSSPAGSGNSTYNVSGGTLDVGANLNVGAGSTGTAQFNQSNGAVTADMVFVSNTNTDSPGSSLYTITGGTLEAFSGIQIGDSTNGTGIASFTQSGDSTVTSDGDLTIGNPVGTGSASYTLNGGALAVVGNTVVGVGSSTGAFVQTDGLHAVGGALIIGDGAGSNGLYTLTGGTLITGLLGGNPLGDVIIGLNGTGEVDNSGGQQISASGNGVTIGWNGSGTYKLTGTGSLDVTGNLNVGVFGAGVFLQGDGAGNTVNSVSGSLYISSGFGGPASFYTLTDGQLNVGGSEIVGFGAQGSFTHSGGSNSVGGDLILGLLSNGATQFGDGTYTLGGTAALTVAGDLIVGGGAGTNGTFHYNTAAGDSATLGIGGSLVVGDAGTGTFNQAGSLNLAGTTIVLGRGVGGIGTYNLTPGADLTDAMIVGDAGTGIFNNTAALHIVGGDLTLGNQLTGDGTYNLTSGGITSVSNMTTVGGAGTGTFVNDGSSHYTGALTVADQAGSTGSYTLQNDGALYVSQDATIGGAGNGTFSQSGVNSSTTVQGAVVVGRDNGGNGTVNLADGQFNVGGDLTLGNAAGSAGTFNQSGGSNTVGGGVVLGVNGGTGVYNLSGGSLTAGTVSNGNGVFNFSGGTVSTAAGFTNQGGLVNISGSGTRVFNGDVTNGASGTFKVTNTSVIYTGNFTNNGAYISDPASHFFQNLTNGQTGYMQGGAGDVFSVAGSFLNTSLQNTLWSTGASTLAFTGAGVHQFDFAGANYGANLTGYNDNFAFGDLEIEDGAVLSITDGNADNGSTALYVGVFNINDHNLGELANVFSPFDIYYDPTLAGNAYLNDLTYALSGGGYLKPIDDGGVTAAPEPTPLSVVGAGLFGLGWARRRRVARGVAPNLAP